MCAKSVCHRLKRFALANKESQAYGKAPEVVVSYHLPLLIGFVRFGCSPRELAASEFEISPCGPLSLVQVSRLILTKQLVHATTSWELNVPRGVWINFARGSGGLPCKAKEKPRQGRSHR